MWVKMGNNNNRNSNEGKGFAEYRLWRHEKKKLCTFFPHRYSILTNKYIIITHGHNHLMSVCASLAEKHKEKRRERERCLLLMHTHIYSWRMMMTAEKGLK